MNENQKIKKGSFIEYLKLGIFGGIPVGLIFFGVSLLEKKTTYNALLIGVFIWIVVIVLFGVGFIVEEYFIPKKRLKRLKSEKYSFLHENSFQMHSDFFFEGTYNEYFVRIFPMSKFQNTKKDIEYDIIVAYYTLDSKNSEEREKYLTDNYFLEKLHFSNHCVGYLPEDWKNPNFKYNLDGLVSILKREKLKPISKEEWENSFGKKLEEEREKEELSRTKQILKIGKILDVKYIKKQKNHL